MVQLGDEHGRYTVKGRTSFLLYRLWHGDRLADRSWDHLGNVEFQVWKSALQVTNTVRTQERSEGSVFLVSGFIFLIWGMAMVYNSR